MVRKTCLVPARQWQEQALGGARRNPDNTVPTQHHLQAVMPSGASRRDKEIDAGSQLTSRSVDVPYRRLTRQHRCHYSLNWRAQLG